MDDHLAVEERQEMINRHSLCLNRLRRASEEAVSLRRENFSLRSINVELRLLIHSSLAQASLRYLTEKDAETVTENVHDERVLLRKSISVKCDDNGGCTRRFPESPNHAGKKEKQKTYSSRGKKEVELNKQGSFKTELCNKWQHTRECPYGTQCQFAHGVEELRPVIRHPRYKTQLCRMVLAGINCPYGHRCHFRHFVNNHSPL